MKKILITIFTFGVLSITSAFAQKSPFSYSYIQAGYSSGNIKVGGLSLKTNSPGLGLSITTSDRTFIAGSISSGKISIGGSSVNIDNRDIGFGVRTPISDSTDLVGMISYVSSTLSNNGAWITETGYSLDAYLRHALSEKVELASGVGLAVTGSERTQTTSAFIGARFKVSDGFSIGVNGSSAKNNTATSSGLGVIGRVEY